MILFRNRKKKRFLNGYYDYWLFRISKLTGLNFNIQFFIKEIEFATFLEMSEIIISGCVNNMSKGRRKKKKKSYIRATQGNLKVNIVKEPRSLHECRKQNI